MRRFTTLHSCMLALPMVLTSLLSCAGAGDGPAPNANTPMSWEQFRAQVYQEPDTGLFIVNGDGFVEDEAGLRDFYARMMAEQAAAQPGENGIGAAQQPLAVNRVSNLDDHWPAASALNITYCVSSASFGANYVPVVNAMATAAAAWQGTGARVAFVRSAGNDSNCTTATSIIFNVRQVSGQKYLARAFLPSSARADRELLIDSSSFGAIAPYTLAGILRHELGHTLGFRHEHTRPEAGTCFEDNSWRALTTYDSASVMHYPQCNGTNTGDLVLTARDTAGVRLEYPANPIDEPSFFVDQVYRDVLNRAADPTALVNGSNWLQACNGNPTCLATARRDFASSIFESAENRTQNPELTPGTSGYNGAYITNLYTNFLQRQPDTAGYNWWLGQLNSSGDYHGVLNGFITSSEYRLRFGPQ